MTTLYIMPASLLYEAARILLPPERLCFVTGLKCFGGSVIVLTQLIEIESDASRVHVDPKPASVFRAHQRLLSMGQEIEGQFHSHPGFGMHATHPSGTDLHTAGRWENGSPFLGGIFSEDGKYVRFFNNTQRSEVMIYGRHFATNDANCFELPSFGVPSMCESAAQSGVLAPNRPPGSDSLVEPAQSLRL